MAQKDQKRTQTTVVFPERAKNKHLLTEWPYFVCNYSIQHYSIQRLPAKKNLLQPKLASPKFQEDTKAPPLLEFQASCSLKLSEKGRIIFYKVASR